MTAAPNFFTTNDLSTVKRWEIGLEREHRDLLPLMDPKSGLIGKEKWRLIKLDDMLTKKAGDTIRNTFKYQISDRGRAGQEELEGYESGYQTSTHTYTINVIRHAVKVEGEMADQRVEWDVMDEAGDSLADWFAKRMNFVPHLHATGWSLATDAPYTFHNTIEAPHADYILRPNGVANAQSLTTADKMSLKFLEQIKLRIEVVRPYIRPAKIPGVGNRYVCWLSPEMVRDLRDEGSDWYSLMRDALRGGKFADNPLLSGALGEWPPFVFMEDRALPPGIHSTQSAIVDKTRRGWIGGAGSLVIGFGRGRAPGGYGLNKFRFADVKKDYGADLRVAATTIVGIDRPEYTKPGEASARPVGVIAFETYADHEYTASEVYSDWLEIDGVSMAV